MSNFNIHTLFLHHKNNEVTRHNIDSFKKHGNTIITLRDAHAEHIEGDWIVPDKTPIPRGDLYWENDTTYLNYILMNRDSLTATHYMFCEWDCHVRCNLEKLLDKYKNNNVTVPHIITPESANKSMFRFWFDTPNPKDLAAFQPSTFMLFKKEAIIKIAELVEKNWTSMRTNTEARIGTASNMCGYFAEVFDYNIAGNIRYFSPKFIGDGLIYHPVKRLLTDEYFDTSKKITSQYAGMWEFGRISDNKTLAHTFILDSTGRIGGSYRHYNETFWKENENGDLIIMNGDRDVTSVFKAANKADIWLSDQTWIKRKSLFSELSTS
jgi:hypothetical protein